MKPFPYGLDIVIKKYRRTGASNAEVRENHFYLFIEDRGVDKIFPFFTDVVVISTVVRLFGQEDLTQRTCCLCHLKFILSIFIIFITIVSNKMNFY